VTPAKPITHQDIIDRREALGKEYSAAYQRERARIDAEKASLQELCGGLGHFFAEYQGMHSHLYGRQCVFCCKPER
jgi:hypothetical protein